MFFNLVTMSIFLFMKLPQLPPFGVAPVVWGWGLSGDLVVTVGIWWGFGGDCGDLVGILW